ncbi:MAG: MOP flippase family protein [Hyphomicrobiaceae bacterium]|nr:MAG: MOP flippase family protein [Hyphomicrobiaceae bacterium]
MDTRRISAPTNGKPEHDAGEGRRRKPAISDRSMNENAPIKVQSAPETANEPHGDLKASARASARWSLVAAAVSGAVQVLRVCVLVRFLLEADDFGLMALAVAVTYLASPLADMGTMISLIHRQNASREEISSLYWFNVALGLALSLALCLLAPLLAQFFAEGRLTAVLRTAALTFAIDGFGLIFIFLLKRDLNFRLASIIETGALLAGTVVTFALALLDAGVWSLVIGLVVQSVVRTALAMTYGFAAYPVALRLRVREFGVFLHFGKFQMAQTAIVRVSERFDQVILGLFSGTTSLGLYSVANNLASIPVLHVLPVLGLPAVSMLSRAQAQGDDGRLARGYFLAAEMMMVINTSISFGLLAIAPTLVLLVLGSKWLAIIPILQCLCVAATWYAFYALSSALLVAKGAGALGLAWRLGLMLVLVSAAVAGARLGEAVGLALAIAGVLTLAIVPFYWLVVRRLLGPSARQFSIAVGAPTAMAAVMAVIVKLSEHALAPLPLAVTVALQVLLGVGVFAGLLAALRPAIARELVMIVPYARITNALLSILDAVEGLRRSAGLSR